MEIQPALQVGRTERAMKPIDRNVNWSDREDLQLLGLSRIPRCVACPRLEALREAHVTRTPVSPPWPPAPPHCRHQVCAPFLRRFAATPTL